MLPVPYDPKLSSPGLLRAKAINSPTDVTGRDGGTISTSGDVETSATGAKSRTGS
jgi:hypothetical protein